MSRQTRGSLHVASNSVFELNDVFRRVRDELDEIQGLRGRAVTYDRIRVGTPTEAQDAEQFGSRIRNAYTFTVVGTLAVATKVVLPLPVIAVGSIVSVYAHVETAPVGAALILDVNKNGDSIWKDTTRHRVEIKDGETEGTQTKFDIASLKLDDSLSLDVDQVGSTTAGADLVVQVRVR